jgi:carboxylesterase type B
LFPIAFGPRIDVERSNPFLPAHPHELIESGKYNDVPLIIGLTQNEGALTVSGIHVIIISTPTEISNVQC